jgi:amidophosphoribosyltransferase
MMTDDKFHEHCGVFGVWRDRNAVVHTGMGLAALQHRGQESCGIAVSNNAGITKLCATGNVTNFMADPSFNALSGDTAIGHVRYSTVGDTGLKNAQPLLLDCPQGQIAICHNGQILNFAEMKEGLRFYGIDWQTNSDTELILQLCKLSKQPDPVEAIVEALTKVRGAFSIVMLANGELIVARDPHGFRPLCLGKLGEAIIVCSETCALDAVGATYVREIEPGEITVIGANGVRTVQHSEAQKAHCIFEHVYFARPDSYVFGTNVGSVRVRLGLNLAREAPADADVIIPVPDSGMWAALGYQEGTGLPLRLGLVRNSYMGRTFIHPDPNMRLRTTQMKLNAMPSILSGKRVVLIDDSIVRGTTMTMIVQSVRSAGATEVHVRIASPPPVSSCFYGINIPTTSELLAARQSVKEICRTVRADTLAYLSLEGLRNAVGHDSGSYCSSCYTGHYSVRPAGIPDDVGFFELEKLKSAA